MDFGRVKKNKFHYVLGFFALKKKNELNMPFTCIECHRVTWFFLFSAHENIQILVCLCCLTLLIKYPHMKQKRATRTNLIRKQNIYSFLILCYMVVAACLSGMMFFGSLVSLSDLGEKKLFGLQKN